MATYVLWLSRVCGLRALACSIRRPPLLCRYRLCLFALPTPNAEGADLVLWLQKSDGGDATMEHPFVGFIVGLNPGSINEIMRFDQFGVSCLNEVLMVTSPPGEYWPG